MEGDDVVIPVMRDRVPEGGYISRSGERQIKSREIRFIGFRTVDGVKHCLIAATQKWSDAYFAQLAAQNPGPIGTPRGEQWKMLIPYNEVQLFFKSIEGLDEDRKDVEETPVVDP